ncbi:MAG: hypothetical protein NHB15_10750 [Methanosarcina barkeri]|nr:hypothetical protein [Methanosarcina sp. ERenArc_MAG2]
MSSTNCEDLSEFTINQDRKPDSEFNGNRQASFLAGEFYRNSVEHLQDELARIGALIRLLIEKSRDETGQENQDFPGMFISETEANSILQAVCCGSETFRAQELKSEEIEALERTISKKKLRA